MTLCPSVRVCKAEVSQFRKDIIYISRLSALIDEEYTLEQWRRAFPFKDPHACMTEEERAELRAQRIQHRLATAANNTMLPEHVIATIGAITMQQNPHAAMIMAGVCRYWRRSLCSQSTLWSHLVLGAKTTKAKIDIWRERSGSQPVCLDICKAFDQKDAEALASALGDLIPRIRSLKMIDVVEIPELDFKLESLTLDPPPLNYPNYGGPQANVDFYIAQPTLRHVDFSYVTLRFPLIQTDIVSAKFIHVHFQNSPFPKMPNLESLYMAGCREVSTSESSEVIVMNNVRHYRGDLKFLGLQMPNLLELDMHGFRFYSCLRTRIGSVLSQLTFLDMGFSGMNEALLDRFLPELHQVRFFGIANIFMPDSAFERLVYRPGNDKMDRICPNLVALDVSATEITAETVKRLVESRLPSTGTEQAQASIEWLCIDNCSFFDPTDLPALRSQVKFISADFKNEFPDHKRTASFKWDFVVPPNRREGLLWPWKNWCVA